MYYIGIDPSYTKTGLAMYKDGELVLTYVEKEEATGKDYQTLYHRTHNMSGRIIDKVCQYGKPCRVISEEPLPNASFSSGLFALDTILFYKLSMMSSVEMIYNVHPSYLVHIHGKRGYTKTDSVNKAKKLIELFRQNGINVILDPSRLAHDTAEALIFLTRLLVLDCVQVNNTTFRDILSNSPEFHTPKEKLLYRKEGHHGER